MKYLLTSWKTPLNDHQLSIENRTPTKTTRIKGYGFGVTFSGYCFKWNHIYTAEASDKTLHFVSTSTNR